MEKNEWLKYTLHVASEQEEAFVATVLDSPYTFGWTEPRIEVLVTENGYDYEENHTLPIIAYLFEPMNGEEKDVLIQRLEAFLAPWKPDVVLAQVEVVEEENDSWKEAYQEVEVGSWWIAPSWTPAERLEGKEKILWIDPGAAFGTGYHGTTQDILLFLQEMNLTGKRVLDIGTGSGILSIFAAMNGASIPIYAVDINPQTSYEVEQNLLQNGRSAEDVTVIIGDPLDADTAKQLPPEVDLILINIGGDEDIAMLPVVEQTLARDGQIILSGIVEWILPKVETAYGNIGFHTVAKRQSDEWVTLVMNR
ncbi:MAG TPA: 50S ribosomal protein L11 methyltransferase [Candidatus Bathyarchaeia archaeon]|nr:50S ribosomal protein L11 methyltransferase [Candidatus Bathyarchaeia archaeon]